MGFGGPRLDRLSKLVYRDKLFENNSLFKNAPSKSSVPPFRVPSKKEADLGKKFASMLANCPFVTSEKNKGHICSAKVIHIDEFQTIVDLDWKFYGLFVTEYDYNLKLHDVIQVILKDTEAHLTFEVDENPLTGCFADVEFLRKKELSADGVSYHSYSPLNFNIENPEYESEIMEYLGRMNIEEEAHYVPILFKDEAASSKRDLDLSADGQMFSELESVARSIVDQQSTVKSPMQELSDDEQQRLIKDFFKDE